MGSCAPKTQGLREHWTIAYNVPQRASSVRNGDGLIDPGSALDGPSVGKCLVNLSATTAQTVAIYIQLLEVFPD